MDIDIEKFRNRHDNETEWDLKKNFMLTHKYSLPIEQLECLTNCYANVKLYGCKYTEDVMEKLASLEKLVRHDSINSDRKNKKKSETNVNPLKKLTIHQKINKKKVEMNKQKSHEVIEIEKKFKKLKQLISVNELKFSSSRSNIEILTMSCDKACMSILPLFSQNADKILCTVLIDQVFISTGQSTNKKSAKMTAFTEAIKLIRKNFHDVVMVDSRYKLIASNEVDKLHVQNVKSVEQKNMNTNENFLSEFVMREFQYTDMNAPANCISQLHISTSFNQVETKYDLSEDVDGSYICDLTLNGFKIATGRDVNKSVAKMQAAEAGINFLKKKCKTIIFKKRMDAESGDAVERDHLLGNNFKNNALPTSNIGNKLLRKLGWTGGGVGKTQGISEPIFLEGVLNREGLGLGSERGLDPNFSSKVTSSIISYMRSDKQDDLVFSLEFTKEERSVIHQIAKKYHLTTKSHGPEGERFLVLSRKRTPMELVKHIEANNGETHKYLLLPSG